MAKSHETGRKGEELAEKILRNKGYMILERNWRLRQLEIDLIALDGDELVFVEVKTRSEATFGQPYENINHQKEQALARAANYYIRQSGHPGNARFDVISIILPQDLCAEMALAPQIEHIKDAFWPR